jgi:hypothetical protein
VELPDDAVKEAKTLHKISPRGPHFARLLEGWELGAITVGMALVAALLAVPRAATPGVFPVPLLDVGDTRAARARAAALVEHAEREGLPFETRAVGDALRRFGMAMAGGGEDGEHVQRLIADRVRLALAAGQDQALLRLRAVQARLFVRAVRSHRFEAPPEAELRALGGDFAKRALANGWIVRGNCVANDDELVVLFERRWGDLTRLRDDPRFKPTLGELRRYFRFLLLHPERHESPAERARARLRYVEALARFDTEYPLALARGSLLAELGMMPESAHALGQHLAQSGRASWNLRARNYLLYAARGQAGLGLEAPEAP